MEINVYLVNIKNKKVEDILNDYKEYLTAEDIKKAKRFKFELNQKQSLISSSLKNKYIGKDIYYNNHGKPLTDSVFFNISHSDNMIVMAKSSDVEVGIDIEHLTDDVSDELINHICNEKEKEFILKNKSTNFYYIWTRKEAILKCFGTGLINELKSIDAIDLDSFYFDKIKLHTEFINDYVFSAAYKTVSNDVKIVIFKEKNYE